MKITILIILMMIMIPLAFGLECQPAMQPGDAKNCSVTSLWNYGTCTNFHLAVYKSTGSLVGNFTYHALSPYCQTNSNITTIGDYTGVVENGDTTSWSIVGDKQMMSFTVISFLIVFNLLFFVFPFIAKDITKHKATDYILKNLVFMMGVLFLWLNITILRQMANDAGLGIDNLLAGIWWFVTLGVAIVIFAMCYTTLVGYMQMLKESQMKERMGDEQE